MDPPGPHGVKDAYCLLNFGDSITTDHISPAGSIHKDSPAAKYLLDRGVDRRDFNSYGSRRGNDEVMARGTFANIRIVNKLLNGEVGPKTIHIPTGDKLYVFDAATVKSYSKALFYHCFHSFMLFIFALIICSLNAVLCFLTYQCIYFLKLFFLASRVVVELRIVFVVVLLLVFLIYNT